MEKKRYVKAQMEETTRLQKHIKTLETEKTTFLQIASKQKPLRSPKRHPKL